METQVKVKVRYCGPNADGDPRTIEVLPSEVAALEEGGLWEVVKSRKSQGKEQEKKEVTTDG